MKLRRVNIKNFRSLRDTTIEFDSTCQILIGINESGKSNILHALRLIRPDTDPTEDDVRIPRHDEKFVTESYVKFIVQLEKNEIRTLYNRLKSRIITNSLNTTILTREKNPITIKEFCNLRTEGLFTIDLMKKTKGIQYYSLSGKYAVQKGWKKPSTEAPKDYRVRNASGSIVAFRNSRLINLADSPDIPAEYLESISADYVNECVGAELITIIRENLFSCVFWEYTKDFDLPASIRIAEFKKNPDSCIPLKNMFQLAGVTKIRKQLTDDAKLNFGIENLLDRVSTHATDHIHGIWKEYKNVRIDLRKDGHFISIGIQDTVTKFSFYQRSDGFRRFVSFLLIVSAMVKTNEIKNSILLIDEPDIGLHPSGARYLRDELINISASNIVVYSTHSIFMIDKKNIDRHLIIKKENEVTTIELATDQNYIEEEVLYRAIGASVYDSLKARNIILEGWWDEELFEVATGHPPASHKSIKTFFGQFGLCKGMGVHNIKQFTPILDMADREAFIITDDDEEAIRAQRDFVEMKGHGEWHRYSEIFPGIEAETGEDFIKLAVFKERLTDFKKEQSLGDLDIDELSVNSGRWAKFKKWLDKKQYDKSTRKKIIVALKNKLFVDLKSSDITESYFKLLSKLKAKLESE